MAVFTVDTSRVYIVRGRRYLTRDGAIGGYARIVFMAKHPCECERPDFESGYPGVWCGVHEAWERVRPRYMRWLRRCLRTKARESQAAPHTPTTDAK